MTHPVTGAPADVGTGHEARDRSAIRGPSRVREHTAARERIPTFVLDEHEDIAHVVASRIAALIREREAAGRRVVLGLATGSTPIGVYRELIRLHRGAGIELPERRDVQSRRVLPDGAGQHPLLPPLHVGESVRPRGRAKRRTCTSRAATSRARRSTRRASSTSATSPRRAGSTSRSWASARRDTSASTSPARGPIAATRLVHLDAVTRRDAAADFFGEEFVPKEAITMGVATILEAREIAILATGEHKASIVRRAVEGEIHHEVAATFLQRHPHTTFYVDRAAGADLTRIATPWLLDEVQWTPRHDAACGGLAVAARPAVPSSSSRSGITRSTGCRRSSRATGRPVR